MGKAAKQYVRSALSFFMAFAMVLGTVHMPAWANEAQNDVALTGLYRIYSPVDSTQRMAPGSNTASDGNTLWLWEQEAGAPYNCEMFRFEKNDDGTYYWYNKQSSSLVMQAGDSQNTNAVTMHTKDASNAAQKWTIEKVPAATEQDPAPADQYYLKNGDKYVSAGADRHTAVTLSDTPKAWKFAKVEASVTLSLSASSVRIGDSVTAEVSGYDDNADAINADGATLTSSDTDIAVVEGNVITAKGEGTATITADLDGSKATAELTVRNLKASETWGGIYRIDSAYFEGVLLEPGNDTININYALYVWGHTALIPQRMWVFSDAGDGYVYWHPMSNTGLVFEDPLNGTSPTLQEFSADDDAQKWQIVKDETSGNYRIQNKSSGKYLGAEGTGNYRVVTMGGADEETALWVMKKLEGSVSLSFEKTFLRTGDTQNADVAVKDAAGALIKPAVTLTSSDPEIISVNGTAVTGAKAGSATITASAEIGGTEYSSNPVRITVTDEEPMFTGQEWYKDIETAEVNREPSHADFIPYQDAQTAVNSEKSALDDVGEEASTYYKLLSQRDWDFALVKNPAAAEEADAAGYLEETLPAEAQNNFQKEFVPHSWQTYRNDDKTFKYFDEAIYTNSTYPWVSAGNNIDYDDPQAPLTYNPIGYYRTQFDTPEGWDGREVFISFQGVKSAYYLYINGKAAGYTEDSHTAHDFNITPYLNKSGKNTLALKVYRWSDGSYLENQDYIQQSGILRDVYLYSKDNKAEIRDFFVQTKFNDRTDKNSDVTMTVDVDVRNLTNTAIADNYTVDVKLLDASGAEVGKQTLTYDGLKALDGRSGENNTAAKAADLEKKKNLGDRKTATIEVQNPKKWFPDTPNLYMVTLELKDSTGKVVEAAADHVGFREIYKIDINDEGQESMQITGQKLIFRGVNRHDTSLENGNAVTGQEIIDDMKLMKQFNVNAVRTSHYPDAKLLYDLADELGIYVYAEANVESHYAAYGDHKTPIPGADKRWVWPVMDRNMNMVELLKNHASIIGWSYANEATYTTIELNDDYCFWAAAMAVLNRDPSRLRMYERESDRYYHTYQKAAGADPWGKETRSRNIVDVHSTQYPEASAVENYAKNTNNKLPYFEQEYAHAMGQAFGSFNAFWDLNRKYDNVQGGFIWDWVDQSLSTKREGKEEFWGYGGDWIDGNYNADAFCANGVMYADRTPSAKAVQMRYDHQQVNFYLEKKDAKVTDKTVKVIVKNELENTDLSKFNIKWSLKKDDKEVKGGNGTLNLSTAAMDGSTFGEETVTITLPDVTPAAGDVYMLEFSAENKEKPDWDTANVPYNNVVAHEQFDLTPVNMNRTLLNYSDMEAFGKADDEAAALKIEGTTADGKAYSLEMDKTTGIISNYTVDGKVVLEKGPVPSFWRAQTYNDTPVKYDSKLRNDNDTMELAEAPVITKDVNGKHIRVELKVKLAVDADQTLIYDIYGNGEIVVNSVFAPKSNFAEGIGSRWNGSGYTQPTFALPKVGLRMTLGEAYEKMEYFGRGPEDNYIDRKTAADVGVYQSTVTEQFDRKLMAPQENGNHTDVRWIALTDAEGSGIMVTADGGMESSALHVKAEKLNPSTEWYPYNSGRYRHPSDVPMDKQTYLCLDTMQRGVSNTGFFNHIPLEGFYPTTRPDADGNYPVYEKTVRISPITSATDKMAASKLGFAAEERSVTPTDPLAAEKKAVTDAVNAAKTEAAKTDIYTEESIAELNAAIAEAEAAVEKEGVTAKELADAKAKVEAAKAKLERKQPVTPTDPLAAEKKAVTDAVNAAKTEAAKTDVYTEESIAELNAAIAEAEAAMEKEGVTAKELADAKAKVEAAKAKLERKQPVTPADPLAAEKKAVTDAVATAKTEAAKETVYTKESLDVLKAAIKKAEELAAKEGVTAEELAAAKQEIENAVKSLKKIEEPAKKEIPKAGSTFTYKNAIYKVTKSAETGGTVTFIKPSRKTNKKFVVPDTAKESKSGISFTVTKIEKNAFKKNTKLTQVTIGKNITEIGANAFNGAKKLKKMKINSSKLKKVGKNAFKGIDKKCKIKVPKKQLGKYKKLLKKKGQKSSVKITK